MGRIVFCEQPEQGLPKQPTVFPTANVLTMNPSVAGALRDPRELLIGLQHFDIRPLPCEGGSGPKFFMDVGQGWHVVDR